MTMGTAMDIVMDIVMDTVMFIDEDKFRIMMMMMTMNITKFIGGKYGRRRRDQLVNSMQ
jgi:hypothetical protein